MPTVKVRNLNNEEVGEVELSDAVFDAPLNEGLVGASGAPTESSKRPSPLIGRSIRHPRSSPLAAGSAPAGPSGGRFI